MLDVHQQKKKKKTKTKTKRKRKRKRKLQRRRQRQRRSIEERWKRVVNEKLYGDPEGHAARRYQIAYEVVEHFNFGRLSWGEIDHMTQSEYEEFWEAHEELCNAFDALGDGC